MLESIYMMVVKDSLLSYFVLTVSDEFAYPVLLMIGGHDNMLATAAAIAGSSIGLMLSYLIFFSAALLMRKLLEGNPGYPAARHYSNKLSPAFGAVMLLPQVAVIPPFIFGLTRINPLKVLAIIVVYRTLHYIYVLNTSHVLFQ